MRGRATRIFLGLPFIIVAGLFCLYLVFGFFLVNPLAQKLLPWVGETRLASRLSVEQVRFNPFTLEATLEGLKLREQSGQLLASLERLYINIGTTGLFRLAWRIQDVQLKSPHVTFTVNPDGNLNWAVLIDKLNKDKKSPSGAMPRLLVDHIKIDAGNIEYTDTGRPFKFLLQPLEIEINSLSTLRDDHGNYGIVAKLPEQGGTLSLNGDMGLNPLSSQGEIALAGLRLADLQGLIKAPLNFRLSSGTLATDLHYYFAMARDNTGSETPAVQIKDASLSVQDLVLAPRDSGVPVLEITETRIGKANIDLAERHVEVAGLSLTGGKLAATCNVKGILDWQSMFAGGEEKTIESAPETNTAAQPAKSWNIAVREIKMADWVVRFTDQGFARPLSVSADGFGMTAALAGEVGARTTIEVGPVQASLGPIRVLSGAQEAAALQHAALVNGRLKLAEKRIVIDAIDLKGVRTSVILDKNKTLNWTEILKTAPGASTPAPAKPAEAKSSTDRPGMDMQLARLGLDGIEVDIVDRSADAPVTLDVVKGFVMMKQLSLDMGKTVPVKAGFSIKEGGNFNARGTVTPGKASGNLDLKLVGLSFKPFTPYINRFAKLNLNSGAASTRGKLSFGRSEAGTRVDFDGGFAVDGLALTEEETGDPFFGWERLSSDSLELRLSPNSLHINELLALHPFGKVIIFEDKSLNLKRILRASEPEGAVTAQAGAPAKTETLDEPAAFPLAMERLRIDGADFEFADLSLKPQFGTRMHDLTGVVTGLANDPTTTALVELDGMVDEFGSARVRGSIQPFRATDFTDLKLTFHNLEMTNLTPYSDKFAGRKVDSGKLSVDLEYKVKQRQLTGDNKVVINKLKLGERVDSPEAINLPLDLAIAILEDSEGVIDLDLPVTGNLDDPQFSYGRIIWKAVVNVLTKVVTAPFRALGRLIGISSEKLEAVEFDFGAATLLPPEREKLMEIGLALVKRPALTLSVLPAYNMQKDARAIQELRIRQDVAQRMGLNVTPGQEPGPVDTANPRAQKALEALYDDRFDREGGVKAIEAENEKLKDSVKSIHAAMLERLTLQIPVTDAELKLLAQERGESVKQALITLGKVDTARISVSEPAKNDDGETVACKVALGTGNKQASQPAPASETARP